MTENLKPEVADMLNATFQKQRNEYLSNPTPDHAQRVEDLKNLKRILIDHKDAINEVINKDYGNRSVHLKFEHGS